MLKAGTTGDHLHVRSGADRPFRHPILMHPVVFVCAFTSLGLLFALQEWLNLHRSGYRIGPLIVFTSWGTQYFMWGIICWLLWRLFGPYVQKAGIPRILAIGIPVSLVTCLLQEMIWVIFFPNIPLDHKPMPYWDRALFNFRSDLMESMAIFWSAFLFFRGYGYYQQLREKETVAARLEAQLAHAQIAALRMQLNPHFLFNTMNSISSLMRTDIEAADSMLEQMSSLLRMTLERRDMQLIPLHEEIDFVETYLAMQDRRYIGRIVRSLSVDPELHDALVPAMILQPIIENAFVHGLSKLDKGGELTIEIKSEGGRVRASVINTGKGLIRESGEENDGHGVGLTNVQNRLRLHYGDDCSFDIQETDHARVQVSISFPLQLSTSEAESFTRFGV